MAGASLLAAALGAVSTYATVDAANKQNKATSDAMQIAAKNATQQQKAVVAQAQLEKEKRLREAQTIRGKLRVATAESGIGFGGTVDALNRQLDYDVSKSLGVLEQNKQNQLQSIRSGGQADLASLAGTFRSPALEGLVGGLRTIQTGLSIAGTFGTNADTAPDNSLPGDIPLSAPLSGVDPYRLLG